MKKNLFIQGGALAASLLLVTACAQDEMGGGNDLSGNDGTVTFTATLPAFATRAAGDGTTATDLSYAVYAAGETTPLIEDETTFTDVW